MWNRFDIRLDSGHERAEMILHLHIFHLLQTVSPNSIPLDVGVPARGWHGEAYRGHIFWDELFVFPLLNFQRPVLAGACSITATNVSARPAPRPGRRGYQGAMFPWQSGSNGREETQRMHLNPHSGRWLPDHSHSAAARQHRGRLQRVAALHRSPATSSSCASPAPKC